MNSSIQHIMLYDMGSTGTTATVIGYQVTKPKEGGENAILHIKGVGYDRSLGGLEIDLRLRQFFVKKFLEKSKKDADKNPQALVKLLKEAARVKKVLSANTEHMAQVKQCLQMVSRSPESLSVYADHCFLFQAAWSTSVCHRTEPLDANNGTLLPRKQRFYLPLKQ